MMVSAPDILNAGILIVDAQESNVSLLAQKFQLSGEPMFNRASRFIGYRSIGVEVTTKH